MEKTFAVKLREWAIYENANLGNLRCVISEAAEEIEALVAQNKRLREANELLEYALQEAGDDRPGSLMQEWCQQQAKAARKLIK